MQSIQQALDSIEMSAKERKRLGGIVDWYLKTKNFGCLANIEVDKKSLLSILYPGKNNSERKFLYKLYSSL